MKSKQQPCGNLIGVGAVKSNKVGSKLLQTKHLSKSSANLHQQSARSLTKGNGLPSPPHRAALERTLHRSGNTPQRAAQIYQSAAKTLLSPSHRGGGSGSGSGSGGKEKINLRTILDG